MKLINILIIVGILIMIIGFITFSPPDFSLPETSKELSTEYDYSYEYSFEELRVFNVSCDVCDDVTECRYMCMKGCAKKDMFFLGLSPLYGQPEINGECRCMCRPLAHVNEKKLNDAILKENPDICNEITYPTKLYTKDYCHLILAMILEDESICENIEKQSYENSKDACYSMIALAKNNINLCSKMVEEEDPDTSRPICEEAVNKGYPPYIAVPR